LSLLILDLSGIRLDIALKKNSNPSFDYKARYIGLNNWQFPSVANHADRIASPTRVSR